MTIVVGWKATPNIKEKKEGDHPLTSANVGIFLYFEFFW